MLGQLFLKWISIFEYLVESENLKVQSTSREELKKEKEMKYYVKYESFKKGKLSGKSVTVINADNIANALEKTSAVISAYAKREPSLILEERITLGNMLSKETRVPLRD